MKDIFVYLRKDFLSSFSDNQLEFFEFVSRLEGIFGGWNRITVYEPFKNLEVLSGDELVKFTIPKELGMILKLKKLVMKYGAKNFIFASNKLPEAEVTAHESVCWNDIKQRMFEQVESIIKK